MVVGTGASVDAAAVALSVFMSAETIPSACAVASAGLALVGAQHGTVMVETDVVGESEIDMVVAADVHVGMCPKMVGAPGAEQSTEAEVEAVAVGCAETSMVAAGVSAKTVTSAGSAVGQVEGKTGPCAAFDVDMAGQDMNIT